MLARLAKRFELLKGGPRDMPARHHTLQQAIAWSYDLLNEEEKDLFRRLAVFSGGCPLDAVEVVCRAKNRLTCSALDVIAALVDKSLLRQDQTAEDEPRFVMLETIREYALECLRASEDWEAAKRAHADFFLKLALQAEPELTGPKVCITRPALPFRPSCGRASIAKFLRCAPRWGKKNLTPDMRRVKVWRWSRPLRMHWKTLI
jgi:predicted ATPase